MILRSILLPALLIIYATSGAQTYIGLREIISYGKQQYNAGAQNWDIRQDVQGRMYFANNEGLLTFDGIYWKLYPQANKSIARSLEFGEDNRIYIGGQDEIGYFAPDNAGKLSYTSLKDLLPEADKTFADVWDIASHKGQVFFRSGARIFQYTGKKITVYKPVGDWVYMGLNGDQLLAQDRQRGILQFINERWELLVKRSDYAPGFNITDITFLNKDSCLVVTQDHGLYILSGNRLSSLRLTGMTVDPYQVFSNSVRIDESHFIVGTYNNGFYLISNDGVVLENFSRNEGLQNSNVRSIFYDSNNNIWLGLDSGIDFVGYNNSIKHINPPLMNDGGGYAVAMHQNSLYFGLSNGIFQLPVQDNIRDLSYARNDFRYITGGQTWGLSVINENLLAGKADGFFQVKDNKAVPVMQSTGFWTFQPMQDLHLSSLLAAGNYFGIKLFEAKDGSFVEKATTQGFNEPMRYLVIDNNNVIWASHPYRGVYRIVFTGDKSSVKLYTADNGLPSSLNNQVYRIKNRVVIATEKGVYEYNNRADSFELSGYYKEIFGERSIRYMKEDTEGNIWFIQEKDMGVADFSTLKPTLIYLPELKGKMFSGFEHIYPVNKNNIFVGGEKGFYHINFEKYKQDDHPLNVYIRTVKSIGKKDSLLFGGYFGNVNENVAQPAKQVPSVPHQWNSFHIEYSSPLFEQQSNIEYSYILDGFDKDWSEWSKRTEKDYTNLPAGSYTFRVKARNNLRNESAISSYTFSVKPPWYQTVWAYVLYGLVLVGLGSWFYRRQQKKLISERNKHQEEQKRTTYLHQLELEKSEKEVVKLRNEKLESEIEFKNTELATAAMHLVQKEEFLIKIKEEIQHLNKHDKEKADPTELKKILRILTEEEKMNEEWEQFSVHFDKVHGDFLVKLKEKYPALKPHELKLCAYLRMNLSSKEIARLMSISVRGVEISRYRLRKKLEIPTETNLFQFLFDLQRNDFK